MKFMITDMFGCVIIKKVISDKKGVSVLKMHNSFVAFDIETKGKGLDFIFDEIIEIRR